MAERILIVSASIGAGHDGAARELAKRLEAQGVHTKTVDFLRCAPGVGRIVKSVYHAQLEIAPWSYELVYKVFFLLPLLYRPLVWFVTTMTGRRLKKEAASFGADAIVTTYPLGSLTLGRYKQKLKLTQPVITFVTDFAVHPLWVHPGVDLNLCVHPNAAEAASEATGRTAIAAGPLVPERFSTELPDRTVARKELGIADHQTAVMIVAGSWGIGDLESTFGELVKRPSILPIAVCGSNTHLRDKLALLGEGIVIGWTDEMPKLMAASDVLIQNAGGLTCMEAFAAGLPVLTYRPIPGHGSENSKEMHRAGVAPYVDERDDLIKAVEIAASLGGTATRRRAKMMFASDPAAHVLAMLRPALKERALEDPALGDVPAFAGWESDVVEATGTYGAFSAFDDSAGADLFASPGSTGHHARTATRPSAGRHPARQRIARVAAGSLALYAGINLAADAAVAHGLGVAKPSASAHAIYVGVRLDSTTVANSQIQAIMTVDHLSAVVSGGVAKRYPGEIANLARSGVDIANGGWGSYDERLALMLPSSSVARAASQIQSDIGVTPIVYVPLGGVNTFDISAASVEHEKIVRPTLVGHPGHPPTSVAAGQVYVMGGYGTSASSLAEELSSIAAQAGKAHLAVEPLSEIR